MKKGIIFSIIVLMAGLTLAQQGINYKAIVKDGTGNIIANQSIGIQLNIIQGAGAGATTVYSEDHNTTTDDNGLILLDIGEGTPTLGNFSNIDWGADDHFLNVVYDDFSGNTPVDFGTVQFKTVPYALEAANVSGLEAINEGNGIGWRLIGQDPDDYGNISLASVDLSNGSSSSPDFGATGLNSLATGFLTKASGQYSSVFGFGNEASGDRATAFGWLNRASGFVSTSFGHNTDASNAYSTSFGFETIASGLTSFATGVNTQAFGSASSAFGVFTRAQAYHSSVFGRYNVGLGDASNWVETDALFEIGNGTDGSNKSNALTVLKNGTILAPTFDLIEITNPKALVTKEYIDDVLPGVASGLEVLDEGNGIGWRLKGKNPNVFGNIGLNAVNLSDGEFFSSTEGATGSSSATFGWNTTASGNYTSAFGSGTSAQASHSFAIGRYNDGGGDSLNWVDVDPLFEVGNGSSIGTRNSALKILKNGEHTINSSVTGLRINAGSGGADDGIYIDSPGGHGIQINDSDGTGMQVMSPGGWGVYILSPFYDGIKIHNAGDNGIDITSANDNGIKVDSANDNGGFFKGIKSGVHAESSNDANADIILGGTSSSTTGDNGIIASDPLYTSSDIILDVNDDVAIRLDQDNNESGSFQIINGAGSLVFEVFETGVVQQNGSTIHASDRRLKKDISDLSYGLNEVLQLQPKAYHWKDREEGKKSLGLIAQEVQPIINEIVNVQDDEVKTLGISYTELIPVLINAIKQQQEIINDQNQSMEDMKAERHEQNEKIERLSARLDALENN